MQYIPGQGLIVEPPSSPRQARTFSPQNSGRIVLNKAFSNSAFAEQEDDRDASGGIELIPSIPNSPQPQSHRRSPRMSESGFASSRFTPDSPSGGIGRKGRSSHAGDVRQDLVISEDDEDEPRHKIKVMPAKSPLGGGPRHMGDLLGGASSLTATSPLPYGNSPPTSPSIVSQKRTVYSTVATASKKYEEEFKASKAPGYKENPQEDSHEGRLRAATTIAPRGTLTECYIRRVKDFLGGHPTFLMYMEYTDGAGNKKGNFTLAARKRRKTMQSNFLITTEAPNSNQDIKRESPTTISKFKANGNGQEYRLYRTKGAVPDEDDDESASSLELCVGLPSDQLGIQTRKLLALIPRSQDAREDVVLSNPTALLAMVRMMNDLPEQLRMAKTLPEQLSDKVEVLCSKLPVWSEKKKTNVLDFKGRVGVASVKNFQMTLLDPADRDIRTSGEVVLQFGKVKDDIFILDFSWPFSAHTAFAMALTSLDM